LPPGKFFLAVPAASSDPLLQERAKPPVFLALPSAGAQAPHGTRLAFPLTAIRFTTRGQTMNRGIYPILSGALAQEERIQVLSNNVANLKTSGFKRGEPVFQSVLGSAGRLQASSGSASTAFQPVVGGLPQGISERVFVSTVTLSTSFSGGQMKKTGNPLDIAIDGPAFFEVQTPQGIFYTRNGAFHLDNNRRLVTEAGYAVMGDKGSELKLKPGEVKVAADGKITVDDKSAGRLKLVEFPGNEGVRQIGNGLFIGANAKPVKNPTLVTGHLEESNVNSFEEMVKLIEVMRTYESAQKLLMTFDKTTETSIQDLGRAT
jgi:flagellar basal-body rod protein FlgF